MKPRKRKRRRQWSDDSNEQKPPPPSPTDALPGTNAKIEVMALRVANEFQPFHPGDARYDDAGIDRLLRAMVDIKRAWNKGKGRR